MGRVIHWAYDEHVGVSAAELLMQRTPCDKVRFRRNKIHADMIEPAVADSYSPGFVNCKECKRLMPLMGG